MKEKTIHTGHRRRLRERFCAEGLDSFDQRHVLELLLFFCVPRADTAPLAQALLDQFATLDQVLEAPREELEKVPGVGENVSAFLTLLLAVSRYYDRLKNQRMYDCLLTTEQCGDYMLPYFRGRRSETVFLLCLDAKCKPLCCKKVGEGSVNSAAIPIRRIVEMALAVNATTVVLAHNHPSGIAIPSTEDVRTTRQVARALEAVEICLSDHIVVADDDYVSMADSGLLHAKKEEEEEEK